MATERKNEAKTDINVFNYLSNEKKFSKVWGTKKVKNKAITECLSKASKSGKLNRGEPDLIYLNENSKLLILIENKDRIKDHKSAKGNKPKDFAVDGIKHYLKFLLPENISKLSPTTQKYLKDFKIIGIAFSGDINDELNHLISTFIIQDNTIIDINIEEFLNEKDYVSLFENLDLEKITNNISKSSSEINRILRNIDSQKRPVLLSALMICLYEKENTPNDFKNSYQNWQISTIIRNIPTTINDILLEEGILQNKIDILINELAFIKTDKDLNDTNILKEILTELENNVIPLFNNNSSYDIIGKFYEEFLRYAGVSNVKKGIVLTPNHITKLFTELINIKTNDIIFDPACGTGAFLIAGMDKLMDNILHSDISNKHEKIKRLKENQLLGFEKSNTMYSLAISNMLFRGDGKSRIHNIDFFSKEADEILNEIKPSIGFVNPPYGGSDNKKNPTKKEIQFLEKMLDNVSRYGIIIAPLSTYFKEDLIRNRILSKHTLKYVINMPNELFQPNASTHTAIAVFETNLPHNNKKVVLYELKEDGYVLSKHKGRTDVFNKWDDIKNSLLEKIIEPDKYNDSINLVYKNMSKNDEWILQAHMKTDYSVLNDKDFINTIKEHIIFSTKFKLNVLNKKIDEITFMEILLKNNFTNKAILQEKKTINIKQWKDIKISDIFYIEKGERLTEANRIDGTISIPLITASSINNGITSFIDYETFIKKKKINLNKITIDMFANVFYQYFNYFSDDNIHTLYFKDNEHDKYYQNKYINLFLVTILKKIKNKYSFGRQVRLKRLWQETIKLPYLNGYPDFEFMERYIKSLPYSMEIEKNE